VSRTTTPPQHGERRCYLRGCRKPECKAAHARYCKEYALTTLNAPIRVDAAPIAARIKEWADLGYSNRQIAAAAGRWDAEVRRIRLNLQPTVAPSIAEAILNARLDGITPTHAMADATGTLRRGQALAFIGYPIYRIASGIPMAHNGLCTILTSEPATVRLEVATGMTALYRRLVRKPGGSVKAAALARRRNWNGPLAWDESTIDDPTAEPEVDEPYAPPTKNGRDSMRMAELEHLLALGESEAAIARQMGSSEAYIHDLVVVIRNRKKTTSSSDMRKAA
jgi:hypothetical protein